MYPVWVDSSNGFTWLVRVEVGDVLVGFLAIAVG